ncbi:hypothetical protein [Streptomyces sp. NPDC014995]|uniref:hypothetical protein n=1 Tax=Streptomyces sp. NPDC014995 TaxID=3364936 RepID=UPI0036FF04AD
MSEYGVGASTTQHALNPPKPAPGGSWHPEEYQSLFHEAPHEAECSRRTGHV